MTLNERIMGRRISCFKNGLFGRRKIIISITSLCFLIFVYSGGTEVLRFHNKPPTVNVQSDDSEYIQIFPEKHWRNVTDKRIILLWTKFWGETFWQNFDRRGIGSCEDKCIVTTDKAYIEEADAVVFHLGDLWPWTRLPSYRHHSQKWVLFNNEPPPYQSGYMLSGWNNMFNWTLWYRADATVVSSYGGFQDMSDEDKYAYSRNIRFRNYAMEKPKLMSMTVSHCNDDARRYKIVESLKPFLDIDVYGQCGSMVCPKKRTQCNLQLSQYSFHLALEKAHCRDFITDQYWDALRRDQIPIVQWLPPSKKGMVLPKSYINIFDFPDSKTLAAYLHEVAEDERLYNSYFEWKKRYSITCGSRFSCHWCALCNALSDQTKNAQVYSNIEGWIKNDYCHKWTIPRLIWRYVDRFLFNIGLS